MSGEITNNINNLNLNNDHDESEDVVDPWNVVSKSETGVDYNKLIRKLQYFLVLYTEE